MVNQKLLLPEKSLYPEKNILYTQKWHPSQNAQLTNLGSWRTTYASTQEFSSAAARARVGLRLQPASPAASAAVLTQADCGVPFAQWSDAARALSSHQDRFRNPIGPCDAVF